MHGTQTMASVVAACRSLASVVLAAVVFTGAAAAGGSSSKSFNITNSCSYRVWPAISASSTAPDTTGFELAPGQWKVVAVPSRWSGHVWGRTLCSSGGGNNRFSCVTGDCGSGRLDCAGGGNAVPPPATLAEFTLDDGSGGMDTYDVSLVDGFNLPLLVAPAAGGGNCAPTGCVADLNAACPAELRVTSAGTGATVACKSACQAFGSPQYCCTGPSTCKPSAYSELFKKACPRVYSYSYDGAGSTFTCAGGGDDTYYSITFCPSSTSGNTSPRPEAPETTRNPSLIISGGSTTTYTGGGGGGSEVVGGGKTASAPYYGIVLAAAVLGVVTAVLGLIKVIFFG